MVNDEIEGLERFIDDLANTVERARRNGVSVNEMVGNLELLKAMVIESAISGAMDDLEGEMSSNRGFH